MNTPLNNRNWHCASKLTDFSTGAVAVLAMGLCVKTSALSKWIRRNLRDVSWWPAHVSARQLVQTSSRLPLLSSLPGIIIMSCHDVICNVMIWYDMIWHDMIWYCMTWYHMISNGMLWHDIIWYQMECYDMIWHDIIWYQMECYEMRWYDMISNVMIWYVMIWYLIDCPVPHSTVRFFAVLCRGLQYTSLVLCVLDCAAALNSNIQSVLLIPTNEWLSLSCVTKYYNFIFLICTVVSPVTHYIIYYVTL